MNKHLALRILTSLSDGRDPETGVVLPRDHVFQQPDVIRALAIGVETVRAAALWGDNNTPTRAGAGWTEDEERQLRLAFQAGKPMLEIAEKHQRTVCAVASRLESLGCINDEVRRFSVYTDCGTPAFAVLVPPVVTPDLFRGPEPQAPLSPGFPRIAVRGRPGPRNKSGVTAGERRRSRSWPRSPRGKPEPDSSGVMPSVSR